MTSRRDFVRTMGAAVVAAPAFNLGRYRIFPDSTQEYSERAVRLIRESIVIDLLNQFLYRRDQRELRRAWMTQPGSFTEEHWKRFMDTGITAISFGSGANTFDGGVRLFAEWNGFLATYPDWLLRINSVADFERAKKSGRYGIMFGCQDGGHFGRPTMSTRSLATASASRNSRTTAGTCLAAAPWSRMMRGSPS